MLKPGRDLVRPFQDGPTVDFECIDYGGNDHRYCYRYQHPFEQFHR